MASQPLNLNDSAISQFVTTLETQIADMQSAQSTVRSVLDELTGHLKSNAGTTFQNSMSDWLSLYDQIKQKYDTFISTFNAGVQKTTGADGEASRIASTMFSGLTHP